MVEYRIISIGTLSKHPLWPQAIAAERTAHATTTLIRAGDRTILVDPGLPSQIIAARLAERAGIGVDAITDVFLTCFRPAHRRGIEAFPKANWWISEAERESVGKYLIGLHQHAEDEELEASLKTEIALMQRIKAAPESFAPQVDLYPVAGFTPGTAGLLISLPSATVILAGDALATVEHLEKGMVLEGAFNIDLARESLAEIIEIADWIIPGHDNIVPNMTRRLY